MPVRVSVCNNSADADVVEAFYRSRDYDVTRTDTENIKVWDHSEGELDHPKLGLAKLSSCVVLTAKKSDA